MKTLIQIERLLYRFTSCLQATAKSNLATTLSKIAQEFSAAFG